MEVEKMIFPASLGFTGWWPKKSNSLVLSCCQGGRLAKCSSCYQEQVVVKTKTKMKTKFWTLWCLAREISRKGTIWFNCTWSPISWRILTYYQEQGVKLLPRRRWRQNSGLFGVWPGRFQERERFGLTALEALLAEESQFIIRNKVAKLLSRWRLRQNSGLFGVWPERWWTFSRKGTIWSNGTWSPISWGIPIYYQEQGC